jgi:hypothetical protein
VRFHHASDAAFHANTEFGEFCARFGRALQARGVRRGPARGAAHVAGELLLDGWLAREAGVPAIYRDALVRAETLLASGALAGDRVAAVASVCARLHGAPVPEAYADAAFVGARVERALAARTVLALAAHELPELERALCGAAREVADWAPAALAAVTVAVSQGAANASTSETEDCP